MEDTNKHQHNYAVAGSVGSETAERLKRPAKPIVLGGFCSSSPTVE